MAAGVTLLVMCTCINRAALAPSPSTTRSTRSRCSSKSRVRASSSSRDLQAEAAVAVGLVPQVVEQPDQDVVVRGAIDGPVELAVRGERFLAPWRVTGRSRCMAASHRGDVVVGATCRGELDAPGVERAAAPRTARAPRWRSMRATWTLRWVSRSTRPSLLSRRIASRSGVMLMSSDAASSYWASREPGGEVAGQDPPAQLGVGDVALAREDVRLGHDLSSSREQLPLVISLRRHSIVPHIL